MKQIIHIGYPKAGSSFIQDEILARSPKAPIISNESLAFDWIPESAWEPAVVKAPKLAAMYPGARIIIVARDPGPWLESWWRHHTRGLTKLGRLPLWKAIQTPFFTRCIAPHIHAFGVYQTFSRCFDDVRVIPFEMLQHNPGRFTALFCGFCDIPVPEGIQYRTVNASRSHGWCWIRMWCNRAWWRWMPRKWDRAYLRVMKHYVSRVDGLVGRVRGRFL